MDGTTGEIDGTEVAAASRSVGRDGSPPSHNAPNEPREQERPAVIVWRPDGPALAVRDRARPVSLHLLGDRSRLFGVSTGARRALRREALAEAGRPGGLAQRHVPQAPAQAERDDHHPAAVRKTG